MSDNLQTRFPFTLPVGLPDAAGTIHKQDIIRRATGID